MRNLILGILTVFGVGLVVWAFMPKPVSVEAVTIAPATIDVTITEEGIARIRDVFSVSATTGGKLQRVDLHPGDPVVAGQSIVASIGPAAPALLDSRARAVAEASIEAALAAVDLAGSQVAQAQATLDFAETEVERSTQLFDRAAISKKILDAAVLAKRTADAALGSAKANLLLRQRELESARAVLDSTEPNGAASCCVSLFAPVSGQVLRVLTESEQVVQPGTPILEIGNPGNLEIVVALLSRDAVQLRPGTTAKVVGWGGPSLEAKVARISPTATTRVSALGIEEQRVEVILTLLGDPENWALLGHGFRVMVDIDVWRGDGVLAIPVGALFRDGSDWATFQIVDGRALLQPIALGQRNDALAEVLSGLTAGAQVVMHPGDGVEDGRKVSIAQ